jgi:hypothetical protein
VYVRNAKRIFDCIKEAMDLSDGEGGGDEDDDSKEDEEESEFAVAVPQIPPIGDIDVHAVVQREDGGSANASNKGGASLTATGQGRNNASNAGTPLVEARIHTPRQAHTAGSGGNVSELMQFMLMRAEAGNQADQHRHQEREDMEDRRRRE